MFGKKINAASIASGIDSITKQFTIMVDSLKQKSEEAIALKRKKKLLFQNSRKNVMLFRKKVTERLVWRITSQKYLNKFYTQI